MIEGRKEGEIGIIINLLSSVWSQLKCAVSSSSSPRYRSLQFVSRWPGVTGDLWRCGKLAGFRGFGSGSLTLGVRWRWRRRQSGSGAAGCVWMSVFVKSRG